MTDLLTIISEACSLAEDQAPACSLCGFSSVPGLTADAGRVCEPCALLRPRLAMRLDPGVTRLDGRRHAVFIGDTLMAWASPHPSGRWHVWHSDCDQRMRWADSLDDALDVIGGWWR